MDLLQNSVLLLGAGALTTWIVQLSKKKKYSTKLVLAGTSTVLAAGYFALKSTLTPEGFLQLGKTLTSILGISVLIFEFLVSKTDEK